MAHSDSLQLFLRERLFSLSLAVNYNSEADTNRFKDGVALDYSLNKMEEPENKKVLNVLMLMFYWVGN